MKRSLQSLVPTNFNVVSWMQTIIYQKETESQIDCGAISIFRQSNFC
jgi:hypothetical protein